MSSKRDEGTHNRATIRAREAEKRRMNSEKSEEKEKEEGKKKEGRVREHIE